MTFAQKAIAVTIIILMGIYCYVAMNPFYRGGKMYDEYSKDGIELDTVDTFQDCEVCEGMFDEDDLDYGVCEECGYSPDGRQIIKEAQLY